MALEYRLVTRAGVCRLGSVCVSACQSVTAEWSTYEVRRGVRRWLRVPRADTRIRAAEFDYGVRRSERRCPPVSTRFRVAICDENVTHFGFEE